MNHPSRPPVFRVFVSSTFGDFRKERDYLQKHTFKRLRDFCESRGAHFQAIDLRWGINEEAGYDQRTMQLCLHELKRCQQITPKPNFVLLLGQRYGWRPLPTIIPAREFRELLAALPNQTAKGILLDWYRLDENALPNGDYVLRKRSGQFQDRQKWKEEETKIAIVLLEALETVDWKKTDPRRDKYRQSATHQEIVEGALQVDESIRKHVFAYFRNVVGLPSGSEAEPYRDVGERWGGENSEAELEALKQAVRSALPDGHAREFTGAWQQGEVDFEIAALGERIEMDLKDTILRQLEEFKKEDPRAKEEEEHLGFALERTEFFEGRSDPLKAIRRFLDLDKKTSKQALVLHGPSGTGKSAVMAKAFLSMRDNEDRSVIGRFVGATPASQNLGSLLFDLISQLTVVAGKDTADLKESHPSKLEGDLEIVLKEAAEKRPIVIFIDACDQLDAEGEPESLNWLPSETPENVRIVVSMLERPGEPAGAMFDRTLTIRDLFEFIEIRDMESEVGSKILDRWLFSARRNLTGDQRSAVLEAFQKNRSGLYLKLLFERATLWRSDDRPSETYEKLPSSIRGMLNQLFDDMTSKARHGELLVNRILGFLAASRNGLSEDEILSLLHADSDFSRWFNENARHQFMEVRGQALPVVLWSRFHKDFDAYLTDRFGDGRLLFTFYHRQVAEAASDRFLVPERRVDLANFFRDQSSWHDDEASEPNRRRSSELPFQLVEAGEWDRLAVELGNEKFLKARSAANRGVETLHQIANAFAKCEAVPPKGMLIDSLIRLAVAEEVGPSINDIHNAYMYRIVRDSDEELPERKFYLAFLGRVKNREILGEILGLCRDDQTFDAWVNFELNHVNFFRRLGNLVEARQRCSAVLPVIEEYASKYPEFKKRLSTAQYELGYLEYFEGEIDKAIQLMKESAESAGADVNPVSHAFSRLVGAMFSFRSFRLPAQAVLDEHAELEEVIKAELDPGNPTNFTARSLMNVWAHQAEIYYREKDAKRFSECVEKLEQDRWVFLSGGPMMLRLRAFKEHLLGNPHEALSLYREWWTKQGFTDEKIPTETPTRHLSEFGQILIDTGNLDEARGLLQKAVALPDSPANYLWKEQSQRLLDGLRP